ncbi:hypothetical protein D0869_01830 [Hortaea werneckii]|uniref:Uncharacterized protein n=1 Tax=Hortaea werneckii TaxID=91943 RepID=A0A3M6XC81_HORWE|nr:hypothetical protein D0869_01830 [Hortaea werneckii]RMY13907.1 hypothetical protein D0868_01747 [Hortaea werneckii]
MAEDQKQAEDVVGDDEDFTKDPSTVKTTARCKRRADHILHILEECWWNSVYGVLICESYEELHEALEDEKNYTSEAMQKLVLEARDLFTTSQDKLMDFSERLTKTFPSYTGSGITGPGGLWETLDIQGQIIERMERKIDSITSSPGDYEWENVYD